MFLPTTTKEIQSLGWQKLDIILITGDSYIDSPFIGVAIIGNLLIKKGFKTAIIAQPDIDSNDDITRLGEPELFWGVTSGSVDSMVANYTASKKWRKSDDYTPGGINNRRPDRAVIVYSNLIRRYFKQTKPIVLGGIEASLRRICHFDYWSNKIRRSILFDAKADFLVYGMGEKTVVSLANALQNNKDTSVISGLCYISNTKKIGFKELPSFNMVIKDKTEFVKSFKLFYKNNDPVTATGLMQKHDNRYLIQTPPATLLSQSELDAIYDMNFERDLHPYYKKNGKVKALDTIQFSISTHRGCYGECNFCAIAIHEGRTVNSRSEKSILKEARTIANHPNFKGIILDVGGPTANMYGYECSKKLKHGSCNDKRCLFPKICSTLKPNHTRQIKLLNKLTDIKGVKKVFIASGIRYDLIAEDKRQGTNYLSRIVKHHVSGQMKIAPEHTESKILNLMGKSGVTPLLNFKKMFDKLSKIASKKIASKKIASKKIASKKQFLTYYLIAAHPGCKMNDMKKLKNFTDKKLQIKPEQVQIFTPTPSTYSTLMYYTKTNPFTERKIFVETNINNKEKQKMVITSNRYKADCQSSQLKRPP